MLSKTAPAEPPSTEFSTESSKELETRLSPQPSPNVAAGTPPAQLSLFRNAQFPRHYLSIEDHRLYPFTIETKPIFDRYAAMLSIPLSDYTFANNVIWLSQKSGFYQIIEDCFCLFSLNGNQITMLLPPLGEPARQVAALQACFRIMDGYNLHPALSEVEFVYRDFQTLLGADVVGVTEASGAAGAWLPERSLPDYIYRTDDLIELKGNAYKTKRGEINQFRRAYPDHRLESLAPWHADGIRALLDTWLKGRLQLLTADAIADFFYTVEQERRAIERALAYFDTLGLSGLCLFIGDRLEGFTFGERITPDVANVLVEKTNFAIPGSAQYLFREFTKTFADCTYINVGDDLGLENLRRVKMSYRPAQFGDKVTLRRRPASA